MGLSTLVICLFAFWGILENFHEGWHYPNLWHNLGLMCVQYMSLMLIPMILALIALRWPRLGGTLFAVIGFAFAIMMLSGFFFRAHSLMETLLSLFPPTTILVIFGLLFWFGRPKPIKWAYRVAVGLPLLVVLVCAVEPVWRIAGRVDDGNREARLVEGNGVRLIWAPEGAGWPRQGVAEVPRPSPLPVAVERCGIVTPPEDGQKRFVAHPTRIIGYLYGFRMSRPPGANVFVRRVRNRPSGVPDGR